MAQKKKILILVMSCNLDFFDHEVEIVEQTWAKDIIDGKYDNITYYSYTAMSDEMFRNTEHKNLGIIDEECHTVYVPTKDDFFSTYQKTLMCLKTLHTQICDVDYIFRTNTSTYINVPLLDAFVQRLDTYDENIYCGTILASKYISGPYPYCLYAQGNSVLISKKYYIDVMTKASYRANAIKMDNVRCDEKWKVHKMSVDDTAMGFIIDSHLIGSGHDHTKYYKDWNLRKFYEIDEEDWHKQLSIIVKKCGFNRRIEFRDYLYIHTVMKAYDGEPDLSYIDEYMKSKGYPHITIYDEDKNTFEETDIDGYTQIASKYIDGGVPDRGHNHCCHGWTYNHYWGFNSHCHPVPLPLYCGYWLSWDEYYNIPKRFLTIESHFHHCDAYNAKLVRGLVEGFKDVKKTNEDIKKDNEDIRNIINQYIDSSSGTDVDDLRRHAHWTSMDD